MKTIFDQTTVENLVDRVQKINNNSKKEWGKMDPYQMVKHCILSERMYLGMDEYPRMFIGKLFGKSALKSVIKDETPMKPNEPTNKALKIQETGDVEKIKDEWILLLRKYNSSPNSTFSDFVHPFFGKMSKDEIGAYVYKHTDHHLRQFNV